MLLPVFLALMLGSAEFRRLYRSWRPQLVRVGVLALGILSAVWATAFLGVALFGRSSFASPFFWGFFAFSYLGLIEFLGASGPALAGLYRLLRDRMKAITAVGTVVSLLAFVGFSAWAMQVPQPKGPTWSLDATAIRVGAILSGLFFILLLLGTLLPRVIDLLERRSFVSFVGARHVRAQKSGFLTVISLLAILGVALSSCTLGSVVSVMGGFSADLKRKILGNNAHVVVDRESKATFEQYNELLDELREIPGVEGVTAVVHGEVMVASVTNLAGVMLRGIDPSSIASVIDLPSQIEVGSFDYLTQPEQLADLPAGTVIGLSSRGEPYVKKPKPALEGDDEGLDPALRAAILGQDVLPGLIIGRELARTLRVMIGDEVTLVSPMGDLGPMGLMPRTRKFRVAAIFYSGMYEYDATHAYVSLDAADSYFQLANQVSVLDLKVRDAERVGEVTPKVQEVVRAFSLDSQGRVTDEVPSEQAEPEHQLRVRDWREINRNLFSALQLEKYAAFVLLSIAILVASFCIVCTLLLMVTEKGKEIAILKALGASDGAILRVFMLEGILIGAVGTTFGVATGVALCSGVKFFGIKLDPDVYYVDRLPIQMTASDFAMVAAASMTICILSTIYPALAASRLPPVEGLRNE